MDSKLYKHENCIDVAIRFLKRYYIPEKAGWKCKVQWVNVVNPRNPYTIDTDRVFIKNEDMKKWKECKL